MKKYIKIAAVFAALGICGGVFYREFTKFHGVPNEFSVLGLVHPHFLVLGVILMLIIGLLNEYLSIEGRLPKAGLVCYIVGTAGAGVMLFVRGIFDVLGKVNEEFSVSKGMNGMVSGIAGLFHIVLGTGLVMLFISWLKSKSDKA